MGNVVGDRIDRDRQAVLSRERQKLKDEEGQLNYDLYRMRSDHDILLRKRNELSTIFFYWLPNNTRKIRFLDEQLQSLEVKIIDKRIALDMIKHKQKEIE